MSRDTTRGRRNIRFLRLRALLSGGLVLGLGAAVTLASWNDSEYSRATLTTSVFNTESSVNGGTTYADNNVTPATMVLTAGSFYPGAIQYSQVLVRTKATSIAGTVTVPAPVVTGTDAATLGAAFVYRVVRTTATCDATAFTGTPTFVVGAAAVTRAFTAGQETGVTNTLPLATATLPGSPLGFCFEITLPTGASNTLQGKTATATWQFLATSS